VDSSKEEKDKLHAIFRKLLYFLIGGVLAITLAFSLIQHFHNRNLHLLHFQKNMENFSEEIRFAVILNIEKTASLSSRTMIR